MPLHENFLCAGVLPGLIRPNNAMHRIIFTSIVFLISLGGIKSQTIYVSGTISSNTVWNVDTVKMIGNVTVDTGILLTILSGTRIEVQGYYHIDVHGRIRSIGALNDSIYFTVSDTTGFWQDTTSVAGGWGGMNFTHSMNSPDTSVFEFCSVQYAKRQDIYAGNIKGGAIFVRNYGGLVVRNSAFSNNMVICSTEGVDGAFGGAIYCHRVPYIVMDGNKFTLNRSFDSGGAVYIDDHCNTTFISNNRFIRNAAVWYKYSGGWLAIGGIGAAICVSDIAITNLKIFNNSVTTTDRSTGLSTQALIAR